MPFVNYTLFPVLFTMFFETKNKIRCINTPKHAFIHTENYPNLKSISESFKMYIMSRFFYTIESRATIRLYGDSRVSRAQPRINAYEILLQHDWLFIFSRHNRLAETHSHLQLSYHITDRLLAAGNDKMFLNAAMVK